MSQKHKSTQELDNWSVQEKKEQLLEEAKSEILRLEYRADLAEHFFVNLKRQIDSQALEIEHTRTGYEQSRREQALLHEELEDREIFLKMSNLYAVDNYFTIQFNQRCFLSSVNQEDCKVATKTCSTNGGI